MKHHTMLLDCTLRDGAYLLDKKFGDSNIRGIVSGLVKAGIDCIEIGFFQDEGAGDGKTVYLNSEDAKRFIPKEKNGCLFTVLADCSRYSVSNLDKCDGTSIDAVRECFFKGERSRAVENCKVIKDKGYKCFVQPVDILGYSDAELIDFLQEINNVEPYCLSIVDTFGSMYQDDLHRIFEIINHNLIPTCKVGFHSHNNMQICLVCMSIGCTMVSASDLGLANSKIVELGSFGSNGENISSSNRARTKNIYKTSEQAFKFESSKAAGMRYAVVGFDANGKRVLDSGWQTGATYILGKEVVSYRLLFSYTDNRTMTSADTLKIESSITFSAVETKSSVIEVGSFGTDGKNTVSSNRARTVNSYKVSEKTFKFESSKAAGMRYAVVGFDANGKRVLDSGWQTGATYTLGKEVVSYRLLFSYTDNRTMTVEDTLKIEKSLSIIPASAIDDWELPIM